MVVVNELLVTMQRGAITPYAHARIDFEDYRSSLHTCQNFLVTPFGGVTRLPGSIDAGPAGDVGTPAAARLIRFQFSETESYAIEFSNAQIRFHTVTGIVGGGSPVEVVAPYLEADLWNIQIKAIGDVVYIACVGYAPRTLTRTSNTVWTLALYTALNGPWLPDPVVATTLEPAGTGHAIPKMTSLTAPSGTVTSSPTHADAWELFDRDISTAAEPATGGDGWIEYDYGAGTEKTIISYILTAPQGTTATDQMPTAWSIEAQKDGGSTWVIIDAQSGSASWVPGEVRYFEIANSSAYRKWRIVWRDSGTRDDASAVLAGWEPLLDPDEQTSFNLTASAVAGINGDTGFQSTDVNRLIRFLAEDGLWRVLKIVTYTSTTVVKVVVMGPAPLPNIDKSAAVWRLQAWGTNPGWPEKVVKFKGRLGFLANAEQPRTGWLSVSADYDNYVTGQPLLDDDAITFTLTAGNVDDILWATTRREDLIIGTAGDIRIIGKRNPDNVFSPVNHDEIDSLETPPGGVEPIWIGTALIYANKQLNHLLEAGFTGEGGGYADAELTTLCEHLLRVNIKEIHFQRSPLKTLWIVCVDGTLVACTYDKRQGIFAAASVVMPGVNPSVLSMCILPGVDYDVPLLVMKRLIDVTWDYRIDRMYDPYVSGGGSSQEAPMYLMSGVLYSGAATTTITGLDHLEAHELAVFDTSGTDLGDATVSAGSITVPGGASVTEALVGFRYTSMIKLLRPPNVSEDGSWLHHKMRPIALSVDVLETHGLFAGGDAFTHELTTEDDHAIAPAQPSLVTGMLEATAEEGWSVDQDGLIITGNTAYPATIRAVQVTFDRGS